MPPSPQSAASPSRYHANNFPIPPSNYSPASITSTQRQLPPRSNTISNTLPLPTTTSAALLSPSASPTFVIPSSPRTTSHPVDVYRTPPSKIIKAMSEYTAKTPSELSFVAGDFFYVVSESHPDFFEVVNPAAKLRGHVPRNYFESLEKAGQRFSAEQRSKRVEENRTYANPSPNGSYGSGSSANGRATGSPALRIPPSPDSYATPPYGTPPRSAKSPGRSPEGLRSPSSQSTDIQKILVPSHRQFQDIRYYYRIHVQYSASRSEILYRTHDDFWALQVSLLNFFPTESGRSNNRPRIIPFLPAPTLNARDVSARVAQSLQKRLEKYLQELIFMPQHIQASAMWVKFFQVRRGSNVFDIEYPTQEDLEAPSGIESVTSLLNEYTVNESTILVRIARGGKANQSTDLFAMEVAQDITFNELLDEVERRYGARIEGLDYFDESGFLVPMYGDSDLGVLVRTNSEDLRFLIVL
ncbi:hypothetical protein BDR26DRAFT_808240 [Obelidium mucronatum]|nr:hypothetical protein BDR26DRAFT_808240 [Obelidium mucronatum]